jgi:transposase-like protein
MERKVVLRYGDAFKRMVVGEVEDGRHDSCHAAERAYGVRGKGTVARWMRQFGKEHLTRRLIRVETKGDRDRTRMLERRTRELERLVADLTLDLRIEREAFLQACDAASLDPAAFKKKAVT